VQQVFKMLPNPTIAVYVFPHMTQFNNTDVPVPGYTTAFFLYEKNHYAMPGEVY
jgi:conjugative transfer region lipoprotein (TIGR03751 family)